MEETISGPLDPLEAPNMVQRRTRRTRAACELCHARKTRCDARVGHACSTCVFEGVRCNIPPKTTRKARDKSSVPRPPHEWLSAATLVQPSARANGSPPAQKETRIGVGGADGRPFTANSASIEHTNDTSELEDPQIWTSTALEQSISPSRDSLSLSRPSQSLPVRNGAPDTGALPEFIKPCPPSMDPEDVEYLRKRGAFVLPETNLQEAALRCYFQHVQPLFPIVNPVKIISIVKGTKSDEKLSLLLLQALIFVGSTWVDVRLVRKLGFLSRNAFRRSIHKKMRLLYDADYENDRVCLIQTFMLWTFWFEGPNENKDGWHWIGVALSLSRIIGLHQASTDPSVDPAKDKQRRRLWWMLATRDIICSFALSRSPRIGDLDHNVPMLEMEDFDFDRPPDHLLPGAFPSSIGQQRVFAQLSVSFVRLLHLFGRICKAAYPEFGLGKTAVLYSSQQLEGTDRLSSERNPANMDQLKSYERDLDEWRQAIPDELWHTSNMPSYPKGLERAELAHRGVLSMMYHATVMNLHRPRMLPAGSVLNPVEPSPEHTPDPSRAMVRSAARQITDIAMDFYKEDLVESLGATCITCLVLASITHLFDMNSDDPSIRTEAHQRLVQCKAIFHAFSDQQFGGAWALHVVDYILNRLNRHQKDISTSNQLRVSPVVGRNIADSCGKTALSSTVDPLDHPHVATAPSALRSTVDSINDNCAASRGASEVTNMPASWMPRPPFGTNDTMLSPLTLDQTLPDNLAHFLGPDLAWLDFPDASEAMNGISWTDIGGPA